MQNKSWGNKQLCPKCSARFYDLGKRPASCPKCGNSFDPAAQAKPRRAKAERKTAVVPAPAAATPLSAEAKPKADPKKPLREVGGIDLGEFESIEPLEGDERIEEIEEIDDMDDIEDLEEIDESVEDGEMDDDLTLKDTAVGATVLIDEVDESAPETEEEETAKRTKKKP